MFNELLVIRVVESILFDHALRIGDLVPCLALLALRDHHSLCPRQGIDQPLRPPPASVARERDEQRSPGRAFQIPQVDPVDAITVSSRLAVPAVPAGRRKRDAFSPTRRGPMSSTSSPECRDEFCEALSAAMGAPVRQ